ncbi:hypothetical protein ES288_D11G315100v1 [Gossypium darwinii]|uniref:Uncharacterized protein n=1 Tax=Gossypium darwinii TaxID=34276 RepID=A0A5D2ARG0_GOSDA|nr:hypothetical protein ES288_D11G315100v1 [Gossypium darwinii]
MNLPPLSLTTRPDANLKFCESKATSKKIATFALCMLCLGLALVSNQIPQQNILHCSFVP